MANPSSLTDSYGALLTTTLRNMLDGGLRDNITRSNKLVSWLISKGRFRRVNGGERVSIPLMHAQNSTADIYSGYGLLDTTPQDGITTAFYTWAQLAVSIAISRLEERQNSGKSKAIDLLEAKTTQAEESLKELLNNCITAGRITSSSASGPFYARKGRLDSGASGPLPLAVIIDYDSDRSVSMGNINGLTYSFWRNQVKASSLTTWAGLRREMNGLYNDCSKGTGGSPDLIISDQKYWETYWAGLEGKEQYVVSDARTIDVLGGSDALRFRGAVIVWDEVVPDVSTTAEVVDSIGTVGYSTAFFINSNAMEWIVDSETDMISTPFVRPENQDARVGQILWMGAIGTGNRRKLGVHGNVSQSVTA